MEEEQEMIRIRGFWFPKPSTLNLISTEREDIEQKEEDTEKKSVLDMFEDESLFTTDITPT